MMWLMITMTDGGGVAPPTEVPVYNLPFWFTPGRLRSM